MSEFNDWFSCPICGDPGEVSLALVGSFGDITFTCKSRGHRIQNSRFQRFKLNQWRRRNEGSFLQRLVGGVNHTQLNASIVNSTSCPECGSRRTDGSLERLLIQQNYDTEPVIAASLWCLECGEYKRKTIAHSNHVDEGEIDKESDYPPKYIR